MPTSKPATPPTTPTPAELYRQAGEDKNQYLKLLIEHGYLQEGAPNPMDVGWSAAANHNPTN